MSEEEFKRTKQLMTRLLNNAASWKPPILFDECLNEEELARFVFVAMPLLDALMGIRFQDYDSHDTPVKRLWDARDQFIKDTQI